MTSSWGGKERAGNWTARLPSICFPFHPTEQPRARASYNGTHNGGLLVRMRFLSLRKQ